MKATGGPLAGVRVIDVSNVLAGPICAQLLGDQGADVIKVEHPVTPDGFRTHGPQKDGQGLWSKIIGRNKRGIGLDLHDADAVGILKVLLADADVLVENFRPGTLQRWGLGWDVLHELNPRLIVVRITGFGQTGPYAHRAGFGTLAEAMSGFAALTGEADGPPMLPAMGLADSICGITASGAVAMALFARDRPGGTGRGQEIDVALIEPIMLAVGPGPTVYDQLGELQVRAGNRSVTNAPRNMYQTRDGRWLAISASTTSVAERVLKLVGHGELTEEPWFASAGGRAEHGLELDAHVASWIEARTADEVMDAFEAAHAAVAPVYDASDILDDPHLSARGTFPAVDDPDLGPVRMQDVLFRLSETPGAIRFPGRPPWQDTDEVLGEVGIDPALVAELRARGVVR
jgi:crotonobetainyl-CoA:carnitine CoA-transferase CaiB-like acyl-CoA transferase